VPGGRRVETPWWAARRAFCRRWHPRGIFFEQPSLKLIWVDPDLRADLEGRERIRCGAISRRTVNVETFKAWLTSGIESRDARS
jgi:hypothetical protein